MSFDHKPSNPEESKRIDLAGGYVEFDRVNGNLNLSRALGDFTYKENKDLTYDKQMVLALPEVKIETIDGDTEFFIIACDGIWDCLENQEAVDFIHEKLSDLKEATSTDIKVSNINATLFEKNIAKDALSGSNNRNGKEGIG